MAPDPYHGHEILAKTAAHFVGHLFTCPEFPPAVPGAPQLSIRLDMFIAYALHRTRLHESVTYASLYLLQRLKARFPAAKGSSGHRLFVSAYMLASKIICDDTYSNKSWCIVAQHMFQLREINQMEREMCSYLEWQLNVEPKVLEEFTIRVKRDFAGSGPYPPLILPSEPTPEPASASTSIAPFVSHHVPSSATHIPHPGPQLPSPPSSDEDEPSSPSTPEASHSSTTSPASTASPSTPPDLVSSYAVEIVGESRAHRSSRPRHEKPRRRSTTAADIAAPAPLPVAPRASEVVVDPYATASDRDDVIVAPRGTRKGFDSTSSRQKLQVGRDMYAFATRTVW